MENTNIVTAEQQAPNTISASNAIFNVQALGQLTAFANLMADSQVTVPAHLAGKPADCMAIVMQATIVLFSAVSEAKNKWQP